jgi:alpha(1,3/1,4) fucosyltransferase
LKKIVFHASSFEGFWAHYSFIYDKFFTDKLNSLGYDFFLSDQTELDDADLILFSEATSIGLHRFGLSRKLKHVVKLMLGRIPLKSRDVYRECKEKSLFDKTALIVAEGNIHLPENHTEKLSKMFPVVLTWNDTMVDGSRFIKIRVPQPVKWPKFDEVSFTNRKMLVNISANKYHSSPIELYSNRRRSIQYFETMFEDQFDLYGIGWNKPVTYGQRFLKSPFPVYKSYKGVINDKSEVYPKYRFALCYENAQVPGYVTEKIFDCLRCDCIPIYLGAPNITEYVPKDAFIDRRVFPTDEDLAKYLINMTEDEFKLYQRNIKKYLSSAQFLPFLSTSLAMKIVDVIEKRYNLSDELVKTV